jgi:ribonuclease HI
MMSKGKKIVIYTDGSSINNPGKGGLGIVLLYIVDGNIKKKKEYKEGYRYTTNNRMELLAVIKALDLLNDSAKELPIEIYTDSQYVSKAINEGWIFGWVQKNFKGVKNPDLWKKLLARLNKFKNVKFIWVKGHNNNALNETCDRLAKDAAINAPFIIDKEYEDQES